MIILWTMVLVLHEQHWLQGMEYNSLQTQLQVPQSMQQHLAPHVGTY